MFSHFRIVRDAVAVGACAWMALLAAADAQAATAVMIWPIDPVIESDQRGTALWLENRDNKPVTLQTRVVGWQQQNHAEHFDPDQKDIAISPPMVTVQPGQRQLIRLIRLTDATPGSEQAYRILIDEIPLISDQDPGNSAEMSMGVKFQMHYALPLFTYGNGLRGKTASSSHGKATQVGKPDLFWRTDTEKGKHWLVLTNRGPIHARLTHFTYLVGGERVDSDLLGYVLPGANMRWELPEDVRETSNLHLLATVNGAVEVPITSDARP